MAKNKAERHLVFKPLAGVIMKKLLVNFKGEVYYNNLVRMRRSVRLFGLHAEILKLACQVADFNKKNLWKCIIGPS